MIVTLFDPKAAVGAERGYLIRVARLRVLGFAEANLRVNALDLHEGAGVDGLLGFDFLRRFRYCVHSDEGRLLVERAG